jgi:hypothetical protein
MGHSVDILMLVYFQLSMSSVNTYISSTSWTYQTGRRYRTGKLTGQIGHAVQIGFTVPEFRIGSFQICFLLKNLKPTFGRRRKLLRGTNIYNASHGLKSQ